MIENAVAANVLGVFGAVCWAVQLIPQIVANYRRKHARGLQSSMMLLWAMAGVPLGVYNISKNFNLALQIQPQVLTFLSLVTFAQVKYYKARWSLPRCLTTLTLLLLLLGSLEAGLIFALRPALHRHLQWPLQLMAALSALLLALGVGRHYVDVWQHRDVRGVSFMFVSIDAMGDLTSLLSLFFEHPFDYVGCVIYSVELVMWIGIMALGVWYHFWPSERSVERARREAEEAGEVNLDDRPASTRAPSSLGAEGEAGEGSAHSSAVSVFHSSLAESRTFTR